MKILRAILGPSFPNTTVLTRRPLSNGRFSGSITVAALASLVCCGVAGCCGSGMTNCRDERIGPSGAEVYGAIIGAGAVVATGVALEVHHTHHMLKGCVSNGPNGLELQTLGGGKSYLLSGDTANIKAGDRVLVHGSRLKQPKHSTTDQTFSVEKLKKDYGACVINSKP